MTLTNETKGEMTLFPNIKVCLDDGAFLPERYHTTDAGADIRTPEGFTLKAHGSEIVATGVHVQLPPNTVGMLKSKSGLNVRYGIISEGVIDEGYTGEIIVKLYNLSDQDHLFQRGDKITQLVIMPVTYPTFSQASEIEGGDRGEAGIGSTGA
jgi:dUTP pyrophosphatase